MTMSDEIIRELWQIKDSITREYGYDIDAFVAHLQSRQRTADQRVVDLHAIKKAGERTSSAKSRS
jgi:hypothetical protein